MMAPLRALSRLATLLLLVALAAAGAAVAVGSLSAGGDVSIPGFAGQLDLASLRDQVGGLLGALEGSGPVATRTALAGAAAVVLAVLLILGALWPRRPRVVLLEESERGRLAARRRPLRQLAGALAAEAEGVRPRRVTVRARRAGGGRLGVRAVRDPELPSEDARTRTERALEPLAGGFALRTAVRSRRERRR